MSAMQDWVDEYEDVRSDWDDADQDDPREAEHYGLALEDLAHRAYVIFQEMSLSWPGEVEV